MTSGDGNAYMDDILLNKAAIIERCLERIREEHQGHEDELGTNLTRQDAIVLNLLRACETTIDGAMHVVRIRRLGVPQRSRDGFALMHDAGLLEEPLNRRMQSMVGFGNIAIHRYQEIEIPILQAILEHRLDDLRAFAALLVKLAHGE